MKPKYLIIIALFTFKINAQQCQPQHQIQDIKDSYEIQSILQDSMDECPHLTTAIQLAMSFQEEGDSNIAQEVMLDALDEVVNTEIQRVQWLKGAFDIALKADDICQANQYLNELNLIQGQELAYQNKRIKLYSKIKDQVLSSETIGCALAQSRSVAYRGMIVKPKIDLAIHFDFNSDKLTEKGIRQSQQLGQALTSNENQLLLIGHTDSIGSEDYNMDLSLRRSNSVKQFIVDMNADMASQITTLGKGETHLLTDGLSDNDHQINRRVEIQLQ